MIEKAKKQLNSIKECYLMSAFDMIGFEYLENETIFYNTIDGLYNLICDFELPNNEIIEFIINNENYSEKDKYVIFNGHDLWSINNLDYVIMCLNKHMNNEVAEFILENTENY